MKEWVSIEHMTPKQGRIVLVTNGKFVTEGVMTSDGVISLLQGILTDEEITHWMDKPEPPK